MTETGPARTVDAPLTGYRAGVDRAFMWGLLLFLVAGVVQIFLAGTGAFGIDGRALEDATSFDPHRLLGFVLGAAAIVLFVMSAVVRASRRTVLVTLLLAVLAAVVQSALAAGGESTPFVGGLHAFDGLLILGLAGFLHAEARRRTR